MRSVPAIRFHSFPSWKFLSRVTLHLLLHPCAALVRVLFHQTLSCLKSRSQGPLASLLHHQRLPFSLAPYCSCGRFFNLSVAFLVPCFVSLAGIRIQDKNPTTVLHASLASTFRRVHHHMPGLCSGNGDAFPLLRFESHANDTFFHCIFFALKAFSNVRP